MYLDVLTAKTITDMLGALNYRSIHFVYEAVIFKSNIKGTVHSCVHIKDAWFIFNADYMYFSL